MKVPKGTMKDALGIDEWQRYLGKHHLNSGSSKDGKGEQKHSMYCIVS